jgi:hypothetical protein
MHKKSVNESRKSIESRLPIKCPSCGSDHNTFWTHDWFTEYEVEPSPDDKWQLPRTHTEIHSEIFICCWQCYRVIHTSGVPEAGKNMKLILKGFTRDLPIVIGKFEDDDYQQISKEEFISRYAKKENSLSCWYVTALIVVGLLGLFFGLITLLEVLITTGVISFSLLNL